MRRLIQVHRHTGTLQRYRSMYVVTQRFQHILTCLKDLCHQCSTTMLPLLRLGSIVLSQIVSGTETPTQSFSNTCRMCMHMSCSLLRILYRNVMLNRIASLLCTMKPLLNEYEKELLWLRMQLTEEQSKTLLAPVKRRTFLLLFA